MIVDGWRKRLIDAYWGSELSQRQLADASGLSEKTIFFILGSKKRRTYPENPTVPSVENFAALCEALDVSFMSIATGVPNGDATMERLVKRLSELSQEEVQAFLTIIDRATSDKSVNAKDD